mgnify:FL=1|jgi:Nucleoside-diphosphate-sugar epimerases
MSLSGKTLCVIGANGYVGSYVAQQALSLGAKVLSVSRSGRPPHKSGPWAQQVKWHQGNSLNPEGFEDVLKESDAVVHTVGTLIDTSITQFKKPGEPGTYENMNRDPAIAVARKLAEIGNKKMIFLSASKSIPLVPRYLAAKLEAEEFIFSQKTLRATILRPGVITTKDIPFKYALKYPTACYAAVFNAVYKVVPDSKMKDFLSNFDVDYPIDVRAVATAAVISAFDPKFDGKILFNADMESLKNMLDTKGYKFP